MSLSKVKRCLKCRKTEDEVKLNSCDCDIAYYCSDLCKDEDEEDHQLACTAIYKLMIGKLYYHNNRTVEHILELGIAHDNFEALKLAADVIRDCFNNTSKVLDAPDLICFLIELGKITISFLRLGFLINRPICRQD